MSSLDYLDLCRLCLVKDRVSVPIFDGEGDVRQIFLKIAACLPVKVAREDKLPKKICDDCVYKVELFYQFWNTTVNAEKQLLQWLGEVGMEGKQGYVTNVLNPNVMKQEQSTENRLDGSVMQQVSEHQNNMGIGMMDNIGLGIPMIISNTNQQQITSVPMDTSSNSAQNVQAVPGPSSQTTHNQISQNQTSSTQQEEEEESSEDEENSDDECDGDEGLPVKEESEEDPNSRTIEPTTFVNVSLACDEAGPSGLQQQKIADMPEIPMPQTADGDPKSGSTVRDPLEQTYLVVHNVDKYFLLPINHNADTVKREKEEKEEASEIEIKTELPDELPDETSNELPDGEPPDYPQQYVQNPFQGLVAEKGSHKPAANQNVHFRKSFVCEYCAKAFVAPYYLRRHLESHNHARNFECTICHRRLKTKRTLQLHMELHERNCKVYKCTDCDFMSNRKHSLKRHQIRKHTKYFPFKCQYCSKLFKLNADLTRHMRQHVVAPCLCESCGTDFQNEYFLRLHHRALHKPSNNYSCKVEECADVKGEQETSECSKSNQIARRSNKKVTPTTYKCPKCKWRFRNWRVLHRHLKRHLLSYKCDKCAAIFKYKASFLKHKTIHKD